MHCGVLTIRLWRQLTQTLLSVKWISIISVENDVVLIFDFIDRNTYFRKKII